MNLYLRPIVKWPKAQTPNHQRQSSPFLRPRQGGSYGRRDEVPYSETLRDLDRELSALKAREAVMQLAVREDQIRLDGEMRANVSPAWPGVVLSFTAPGKGPLLFACDRFTHWKTNLRAITKGLEALRLVDRYGITETGEQYVGWKELPSGIPLSAEAIEEEMSLEKAAQIVVGWVSGAHDLLEKARTAIEDPDFRRYAHRQAVKHLHPDATGEQDSEGFLRLQRAMKMLDENDGD